MIELLGPDRYTVYCDVCGEEAEEVFDTFMDTVEYKKANGWKSQRRNGEWEDVCPSCSREGM